MPTNNNNNDSISNLNLLSPGSSHNKPNTLQKMNPMMWRQARTVKKAAGMVDDMVGSMILGAPFLDSTEAFPLAAFYRSEIVTGQSLGEGSFCTVLEITQLNLATTPQMSPQMSPQEEARRQQLLSQIQEDRQQRSPPRYAIKQIKRDLLRKPNDFAKAIADMVVEAKYLSRLDHPNILGLRGVAVGGTDAFESGRFDSYFLVLDRLTDSLDQRIEAWQRRGPPDRAMIPRKTNYALQIANALHHLHQRRIIFRDLKPENVGFQGPHVVQLFDFGLAREIPQGYEDEAYSMSGPGSQWYMAVEIFITGKYNLKADVYSWAITVYEMLTENKPFAKMLKLQHVALVCVQGKRPRLSAHKFPPALEAILRAAWGQSVSKRPNILQVVRALEKMIPELGDDAACSWPTVPYDASNHKPTDAGADTDDEDDGSLGSYWGNDGEIDNHIRREMCKSDEPTRPTLGDIEMENDYSMSSVMYGDH